MQRANVGVIGVGAMGMAMARNLHAKGWRVWARDVRPEADAEARAAGLSVCTSAQALAAQVARHDQRPHAAPRADAIGRVPLHA